MESEAKQQRVAEAIETLAASPGAPGDRFIVFEAADGAGKYGYVFLRLRGDSIYLHPVLSSQINPVPVFYERLTEDALRERVAELDSPLRQLGEALPAGQVAVVVEELDRIVVGEYGLPETYGLGVRLDLDPERPPQGWGLVAEGVLNTIYIGVMAGSAVLAVFLGVSLLFGGQGDGRVLFTFGGGQYAAMTLWFAATAIVMGALLALTRFEERINTPWHTYGVLAAIATVLFVGSFVWYFIGLSVSRYEVRIDTAAETLERRDLSVLPRGRETTVAAFGEIERINGVFRTRLFGGRRGPDSIGRDYTIWVIKLDGTRFELAGNFENDPDRRGEVPVTADALAREIAELSGAPLTLNR